MVTKMNKNVEKAKDFAHARHAGQKYGDKPFMVHPEAVVKKAIKYGLPPEVIAAAWLHDTLEDTYTEYTELIKEFGSEIANLVEAVSDEPSVNRRHRTALSKVRQCGTYVVALKLCDRIANIRACLEDENLKLLKMYLGEQEQFFYALWQDQEWDEMWHELNTVMFMALQKVSR